MLVLCLYYANYQHVHDTRYDAYDTTIKYTKLKPKNSWFYDIDNFQYFRDKTKKSEINKHELL